MVCSCLLNMIECVLFQINISKNVIKETENKINDDKEIIHVDSLSDSEEENQIIQSKIKELANEKIDFLIDDMSDNEFQEAIDNKTESNLAKRKPLIKKEKALSRSESFSDADIPSNQQSFVQTEST